MIFSFKKSYLEELETYSRACDDQFINFSHIFQRTILYSAVQYSKLQLVHVHYVYSFLDFQRNFNKNGG